MNKGLFVQMTGLSGAGKTTLAHAVQERLLEHGVKNIEIIDVDEKIWEQVEAYLGAMSE